MRRIVIFSGTTEGRMLSERLSDRRCAHIVCVATGYGRVVMRENPYAELHTGRMDAEEMTAFFRSLGMDEAGLVIDATHPYAGEVSANLRESVRNIGCAYRRILRKTADTESVEMTLYDDMASCAEALDPTEGRILLTTGSKELPVYCEHVSGETRERTWVRILPAEESLKLCLSEGIAADHIIAMQGPFSQELNLAILKQYGIRHLVTRESGRAGGFGEKAAAAGQAGAMLHLIARPEEKIPGITIEEALREIIGDDAGDGSDEACAASGDRYSVGVAAAGGSSPVITLAGAGMGDASCMTLAVRQALMEADMVFGSKRLLRGLENILSSPEEAERISDGHPAPSLIRAETYMMYRASDIIPVLEKRRPERAVILFSGDTGFFSGARLLQQELRRWDQEVRIRLLPGISSVAYLAARLGESYEDARIISLHGKNSDTEIRRAVREVGLNRKTFLLLSDAGDIRRLAEGLIRAGIDATLHIGLELSGEGERLLSLSPEEAELFRDVGIATAMAENPAPGGRPLIPTLEDTELEKGRIPMTKAVIRHESIVRLQLKESELMYDIGGGTGSVAIEAASLHPSLRVITIEKNPEAVSCIRENIRRMGVNNVTVREGEACVLLRDMEKPDCVFIGGSGGRLSEIMELLVAMGPGIRYVINAVTLETVEEIQTVLRRYTAEDVQLTQLQVTDVQRRGAHHMMHAENPVMICSFTIQEVCRNAGGQSGQ